MLDTYFEIENLLLEHFNAEKFTPGFERNKKHFEKLVKSIQEKSQVITVGGTNGKGECSRHLHYLFTLKGKNSALFTSPHIQKVNERFVYNKSPISDELLLSIMNKNLNLGKAYGFSYYEFLFYCFLSWIEECELDFLVLEVGLGGRLDSVNYFDADISLITSISRDHCQVLGTRYREIIHEKLGIIRRGKKLFTSFKLQYLVQIAKNYCEKNKVRFQNSFKPLDDYSQRNRELAFEAFREYFPEAKLRVGDSFSNLPSKLCITDNDMYISTAHNLDGIREMIQKYKEKFQLNAVDQIVMGLSKRSQKEMIHMIDLVAGIPGVSKIFLTKFEHPRALLDNDIKDLLAIGDYQKKVEYIEDWDSLFSPKKNTLLCGSNYFVGELFKYFAKKGLL